MENRKFVVKAKQEKKTVKFKPVQLYEETFEMIDDVIEITGEAKASIIHKMIKFAYENMEIESDV